MAFLVHYFSLQVNYGEFNNGRGTLCDSYLKKNVSHWVQSCTFPYIWKKTLLVHRAQLEQGKPKKQVLIHWPCCLHCYNWEKQFNSPFCAIVPRHIVEFLRTTLSSDNTSFNRGSKAPRFNNSCLFSSPSIWNDGGTLLINALTFSHLCKVTGFLNIMQIIDHRFPTRNMLESCRCDLLLTLFCKFIQCFTSRLKNMFLWWIQHKDHSMWFLADQF